MLSGIIVIQHRLPGLTRADGFALGASEAEIGAFLDPAHFFTLSPKSTPSANGFRLKYKFVGRVFLITRLRSTEPWSAISFRLCLMLARDHMPNFFHR
jgi:hypothetical protein